MYMQKFELIFVLLLFVVYCSASSRRGGRQLDLDAIVEGRLSNHVIGERQSRMLNEKTNVTLFETNAINSTDSTSTNKTAKLLNDEATLQKHSSFVSHYASDDELSNSQELKKSIENLEQLLGTTARVVNNGDSINGQASSMIPVSYLNPIYPMTEDKILAALINQAASNIVTNQQTGELSVSQSNPSPIYASSADKPMVSSGSAGSGLSSFLNVGSNNAANPNKKNTFASISSSIQGFAASMFPNRLTNKFIKRKQSGQSSNNNQIDYASFASECKCVPIYMCLSGHMVEGGEKLSSTTVNKIDQNKLTGVYEPSVSDLIENSASSLYNRFYDPQRLISQEDLQAFQKQQELLMAAASLEQSNYPSTLNVQPSESMKSEKVQSLPTPQPLTIDKRLSNDDSTNGQKSEETKNSELAIPIDERSVDGSTKSDLNNQTEGVLETAEFEALTRMFNSQFAPQAVSIAAPTTTDQQQNCGMFRTCCPVLSQRDLLLAQHLQAQQAQLNAAIQAAPSTSVFAFENFQPTFIDPQSASGMLINQQQPSPINTPSSQAQSSQNNFIYQPVYQSESAFSSNKMPQNNNPIMSKKPTSSNQFNTMPMTSQPSNQMLNINNQMINNQMANKIMTNSMMNNPISNPIRTNPMTNSMTNPMTNSMTNPMINNPLTGNQMINNQMISGQLSGVPQFQTPYNKWLLKDNKIIYQQAPNPLVQPSLSSYLLTKPNYQARNPTNQSPSEHYMNSPTDEHRYSAPKLNKTQIEPQCGRRPRLQFNRMVESHPDQAKFGDYPWYAQLLKKLEGGKSMFLCGATLISDKWLLTASHCLKKDTIKEFKIRLGEYDVYSEDEPYPFVEKNVEEIIRHPNYDPTTLNNDIALIRIEPVDFVSSPHIVPVCRASFGENYANRKCLLSGFGKSEFEGPYQSVLREVELPILDHSKCASQLQKTRLGSSFVLDKGFMCAGSEMNSGSCTGDAGGALVCEEVISGMSIWKAVGLVSWGIGCGQAIPDVFSNLGYYESWIDNTMSAYDSKHNLLTNNPPKEQFKDHNTLNSPTTDDLLSESSSLFESVIKKPSAIQAIANGDKKKSGSLLSIINERSVPDDLTISS